MTFNATPKEVAAGRGYATLFVPALFQPWTPHLIAGANVAEGHDVLDIACGTGVLTRHARSVSGGRVVGLDPAPGMLTVAAESDPSIDWVLGAAEDLPFEAASFDCVTSQFGMMFFRDKPAAAAQMLRVLKPGGSLAIAVWGALDANPAYRDISAILDAEVGTDAGNALRLPFSLGDASQVTGLLDAAGFASVDAATRTETARFASTRTIVEAELRGWLPLFDIHLSEAKIADVLALSDERLARYATDEGTAVFPTSAHIVTARKPA